MNTYTKEIKFTVGQGGEHYVALLIENEIIAIRDSNIVDRPEAQEDIAELKFILKQLKG